MPQLRPGDRAPRFVLSDQDGASISSDSLAGRPAVIYFYPKDDTPGCTTEACQFNDQLEQFQQAGVRVVGVSPDAPGSHGPDGTVTRAWYGVKADGHASEVLQALMA